MSIISDLSYCNYWDGNSLRLKSIISYFNDGGIVEVGVFATEDVADWIANEVSIANRQVCT